MTCRTHKENLTNVCHDFPKAVCDVQESLMLSDVI